MSSARPLTEDQIREALEGPLCRECRDRRAKNPSRTKNPSKICSRCLGDRACARCGGRGVLYVMSGGVDAHFGSCPSCPGTGLSSSRVSASSTAIQLPVPPPTLEVLPRTVVADPPWWPRLHANTVGRREGRYRAGPQRYYKLLTVEQIVALAPRTQPRAHLWLWVLNQHVDWGYTVARAWGFEPQQMVTWVKTSRDGAPLLGTGRFQGNTEHALVCRKGGPVGNAFGPTGGTVLLAPRGRHSEKPAAFFELVERASPGPYLEMFARTRREGWAAWGDQVGKGVEER